MTVTIAITVFLPVVLVLRMLAGAGWISERLQYQRFETESECSRAAAEAREALGPRVVVTCEVQT